MIIKRNTHAPFRFPCILIKPKALRYEVEFTESCRYRFGTDDDADVNKLFGISFITWGSFWFVIKNLFKGKLKALHHYNSIRFGWRYDSLSGKIELISYCYIKGERKINYVDSSFINVKNYLNIEQFNYHLWNIHNMVIVAMPNKCIYYELHPYFGGNRTAPHDMEIKMKRL